MAVNHIPDTTANESVGNISKSLPCLRPGNRFQHKWMEYDAKKASVKSAPLREGSMPGNVLISGPELIL